MKLTIDGIKNRTAWEKAGIALPGYDVEAVSEKAKKEPVWVHFGIGNIFLQPGLFYDYREGICAAESGRHVVFFCGG